MAEVVTLTTDRAPEEEDYVILVQRESEAHHQVVEFDRDSARFVYGPRTFGARADAVKQACQWADQYGIAKVYVQ